MNEKMGEIEAILFSVGEPVPINDLANALEIDKKEIREIILHLNKKYEENDAGFCIKRVENSYTMATNPKYYEVVAKYVSNDNKYNFSVAMLEVLSIIAYKQPITKAVIEQIRGVSSVSAISKLIEYGLIYEADRLNAPGRPILFATTDLFLKHFNIESIKELPEIDEKILGQLTFDNFMEE